MELDEQSRAYVLIRLVWWAVVEALPSVVRAFVEPAVWLDDQPVLMVLAPAVHSWQPLS